MSSGADDTFTSLVFCNGSLLDAVQRSGIYQDSKTFVDLTLLEDPGVVKKSFDDLQNSSKEGVTQEALQTFLQKYFSGPGDELDVWTPTDWVETPSLCQKLTNPKWKRFASDLNIIWKDLCRKMKDKVSDHSDRHSLLYVPNPFVIPGDRFREFYYWDSYWIVNGLLLSDMCDTAKGMIENLLHIVGRLGFVPNGGRAYYTMRSQPPLLTPMVSSYYEVTGDKNFLQKNISTLEQEHTFWQTHRSVELTHPTTKNCHQLSRYCVDLRSPRPEGYLEDVKLTEGMSEDAAKDVFANLASACESGWDFSSRWFSKDSLTSINTRSIIPVDLNVYLQWTEQLLAKFHGILGNQDKKLLYESHADKRWAAIQEMLWSEKEGVWFDLDMQTMKHRKGFYPSNIFPLMMMSEGRNLKDDVIDKVYKYVQKQDLVRHAGGVPTSLVETGQQWDFPNVWPPLVHFFIESLACTGNVGAQDMARQMAVNWLNSNLEGFSKYGQMFEKYHAQKVGEPGGGGEYAVQKGFGWSNGVVLLLLNKYAAVLNEQK